MIRAVSFDVGGTLIEPFPSVGAIYAEVAARHGLRSDPGSLQTAFADVWKVQSAGRQPITKEWWEDLVRAVFRDVPFSDFGLFFDELYDEFGKAVRWRIYDDVRPVLSRLREMKISTAVASNWDDRLPGLLSQLGLSSLIDHRFVSFQMKAVKPQKKFFDEIIRRLDLPPRQILHAGDDPEKDGAAEKSGIRFFHVDRSRPGFQLSEIMAILTTTFH